MSTIAVRGATGRTTRHPEGFSFLVRRLGT